MNVVMGGSYSPSNLRSPYAESLKWLNPTIHAVGVNRSGNQSTPVAAPDSRYQRSNQAAETRDSTGASYEGLTRVAT